MASRKNKQHKLRMKKRGDSVKNKKILRAWKVKSPKNVLHTFKAKTYRQRTTKRRYNKSKR